MSSDANSLRVKVDDPGWHESSEVYNRRINSFAHVDEKPVDAGVKAEMTVVLCAGTKLRTR